MYFTSTFTCTLRCDVLYRVRHAYLLLLPFIINVTPSMSGAYRRLHVSGFLMAALLSVHRYRGGRKYRGTPIFERNKREKNARFKVNVMRAEIEKVFLESSGRHPRSSI